MKIKLKTKRRKQTLFYLFCFLIISLGIYLLGSQVKSEDILLLVEKAGFWAPFVYIIIFASTHVIAPLSGTPVYFAGFVLFKSKVQIYAYFATLLSATINFWLARKWGRGLVSKLVGKKNMNKTDQFAEDYGIKSLILLRLFQGHLTDFISYAYGLTNLRFVSYIIVSTLAPIPWLLLWQFYIFKRIKNIGELTIWWFATLVLLFIISGFFVSRFKKKK